MTNTQTTMKHTPGPWHVIPGVEGLFVASKEHDEYYALATAHTLDERPEMEANAKLIAAAPQLLEALREARKAFAYTHDNMPWRDTPENKAHRERLFQAGQGVQRAIEAAS